jgi:hypothetical protein
VGKPVVAVGALGIPPATVVVVVVEAVVVDDVGAVANFKILLKHL